MTDSFLGKRVLVAGFGLHGGGAATVTWLVTHGAHVTVTDLKSTTQLAAAIERLAPTIRSRIRWVLGKHRLADFTSAEVVIQNPAVPRQSPYLRAARRAKVRIHNDASIFFTHCPTPVIAVTGTRGKSTTTALIAHLCKSARSRVWLLGLPQQPLLGSLDAIRFGDTVIVELSSWQLEILNDQRISPHGAVLTNIYPDHLNRYATFAAYRRAKQAIFANQTSRDFAVVNRNNPEAAVAGAAVTARRFWFSKHPVSQQNGTFIRGNRIFFRNQGQQKIVAHVGDLALPGTHNLENALAAVTVASILGISVTAVRQRLKTFSGLTGRLELIATRQGVKFYNDPTATTPDATMAALDALAGQTKKIVLIAGGDDKKIPAAKFVELAKKIKRHCRAVVILRGQGSKKIKLPKALPQVTGVATMVDAVACARQFVRPGDIILLSPACASFGLFIHEYDRGAQFCAAVKEL